MNFNTTDSKTASVHSTDQYGEFASILDDLWHRWARADNRADWAGYEDAELNQRADERWTAYQTTKAQAEQALAYREAVSDASREPVLLPVAEMELEAV